MPDDRIYDAINLFKYSPTGQGTHDVGGDAAYRAKYRRLASDVIEKLWELWSAEEIAFANLGAGLVGDSASRFGADIRVNQTIEPAAASYATAENQGKLAAASCNLAHEATHLVRDIECYPEEETLCRTIQLFYFQDLKTARSYRSRVTGGSCTAQYLPTTPYYAGYQSRLNRLLSQDLIDSVLAMSEYRDGHEGLESDETAEFVARSLPWWGGLSRRWPSTRGYYLRSLASRENDDYAQAILQILESFTHATWQQARGCAGDLGRIRHGLTNGHHIYGAEFTRRIQAVQQTLRENFGIRSR
jgi:hypothetical protein